MLVITRKLNESITIEVGEDAEPGDKVIVKLGSTGKTRIKLMVDDSTRNFNIYRTETRDN